VLEKARIALGRDCKECKEGYFRELAREVTKIPQNDRRAMKIERLTKELVHLHYRNIRIELSQETFEILAKAIATAYSRLRVIGAYKQAGIVITKPVDQITVKLEAINQYDIAHKEELGAPLGFMCRNAKETEQHEEGIRLCMALIRNGCKMLPISITPREYSDFEYSGSFKDNHVFQRLDGFKRYEAHRRLGFETIVCHLYKGKDAYPGNQRYLPLVIA